MMKPRDLTVPLKDAPAGEWVALSADKTRMVGHGKTMDEAASAARAIGEKDFTLIKMPFPHVGIAASM